MADTIEENAAIVLAYLSGLPEAGYVRAEQIATETGLTPQQVNDAAAILEDDRFVKLTRTLGTHPYAFQALRVTPQGRHRHEQSQRSSAPARITASTTTNQPSASMLKLFISHSSKDVAYVEQLIQLLRSALNLPPQSIRCTSVDGYRLRGGADTKTQLRIEIHEAQAFVGLISPHSLASAFVMFELGARWGARKHLIPLLAPGMDPGVLSGPIADLNALKGGEPAELHQLVTDLADELGITPSPPAAYQVHVDALARFPRVDVTDTADAAPGVATAMAEESADTRVSQLTAEARQILQEAVKDPNPTILRVRTMEGTQIQVNNTLLSAGLTSRGIARLDAALRQLQSLGLLEDPTGRGEVFELTSDGYDIADRLT
jgi:DNA-binding MarR family transcriptional regulator